jgi:hypothetical protein
MKTLPTLIAATLLVIGNCLAEGETAVQEEPAFFSITSTAFEHLAVFHEIASKHRTKKVVLVLEDQMIIPSQEASIRHSIKLEHLDFRREDTPQSGSIQIHLKGLECWVSLSLIAKMKNSTIDFVHILSTDTNAANATALVLRPSEPIKLEKTEKLK